MTNNLNIRMSLPGKMSRLLPAPPWRTEMVMRKPGIGTVWRANKKINIRFSNNTRTKQILISLKSVKDWNIFCSFLMAWQ